MNYLHTDRIPWGCNSLKQGRTETEKNLEATFKPITHSLKKLLLENIVKTEPPNVGELVKPKKLYQEKDEDGDDDRGVLVAGRDDKYDVTVTSQPFKTSGADGNFVADISAKYFNFFITGDDREKDKVYGLRRSSDGNWVVGNTAVKIRHNDIFIKDKWYDGTSGLYELLFKKTPLYYTPDDEESYIDIVLKTNAHRRGYHADGQLNGNGGRKY